MAQPRKIICLGVNYREYLQEPFHSDRVEREVDMNKKIARPVERPRYLTMQAGRGRRGAAADYVGAHKVKPPMTILPIHA